MNTPRKSGARKPRKASIRASKRASKADSELAAAGGPDVIGQVRVLVKARREALGIGLRELARQVGKSAALLHAIEAGTRTPDPATAAAIADALSLDEQLRGVWVQWARLRRSGGGAMESVAAAESLLQFLHAHPDLSTHPDLVVRSGEGLAQIEEASSPAPRRIRPSRSDAYGDVPGSTRRDPRGDLRESARLFAAGPPEAHHDLPLRVPLIPEGTTLAPDADTWSGPTVQLDPVVLPPGEALREAFAWRLSEAGTRRIADLLRAGDTVVIARAPLPRQFRSDQVWLVEWRGRPTLSRLLRKDDLLLLTAPAGAPDTTDVVPLGKHAALKDIILGQVVVALRAWS